MTTKGDKIREISITHVVKAAARSTSTEQAYNLRESESRIRLEDTRFESFQELIENIGSRFSIEKIKDYSFEDKYFAEGGIGNTNGDITRVRVWTNRTSADGTSIIPDKPVQIIKSSARIIIHDGIPFNLGGKKDTENFATLEVAEAKLLSGGFNLWFTIEKVGGQHFKVGKVGDGDVNLRIACEKAIFTSPNSKPISINYIEIEAEPIEGKEVEPQKISKMILELTEFFGITKDKIIGHPMVMEAVKQLKLVRV